MKKIDSQKEAHDKAIEDCFTQITQDESKKELETQLFEQELKNQFLGVISESDINDFAGKFKQINTTYEFLLAKIESKDQSKELKVDLKKVCEGIQTMEDFIKAHPKCRDVFTPEDYTTLSTSLNETTLESLKAQMKTAVQTLPRCLSKSAWV